MEIVLCIVVAVLLYKCWGPGGVGYRAYQAGLCSPLSFIAWVRSCATGAAVVSTRPKRPTGARRADVRTPVSSTTSFASPPRRLVAALSPACDTEDEDLHISSLINLGPLGCRLTSTAMPHSPTTSDSNWSDVQL